jgi:hypothetical protein
MSDLNDRQERLLRRLVELSKKIPDGESTEFWYIETLGSNSISLAGEELKGINPVDLLELQYSSLITHTRGSKGANSYAVTNRGFEYVARATTPASVVEEAVTLVTTRLPKEFDTAHGLIDAAAKKLPLAKTENDFSEIGHKCREALQEFAAVLYAQQIPPDEQTVLPKDKTVEHIRAVLEHWKPKLGETTTSLLDAILVYWGTVSDQVQKIEHRGQTASRPLTWNDARRAVRHTYLIMTEIVEVSPR